MHDQPRFEPLEACAFFADGRADRPQVPGTVARDETDAGPDAASALTRPRLELGRARYDVHCAPCHAHDGSGDGIVVKRGFPRPATFHSERLRAAPDAWFVEVMTRGFGTMFDFADVLTRDERVAVTAYVRALQRSQAATLADVPPDERAKLEALR